MSEKREKASVFTETPSFFQTGSPKLPRVITPTGSWLVLASPLQISSQYEHMLFLLGLSVEENQLLGSEGVGNCALDSH